jgi:hypothetical protein
MFRPAAARAIKNCGRLVMRPYSLQASGRIGVASASLLQTKMPNLLQESSKSSVMGTPISRAALAQSLSTLALSLSEKKATPSEIEQLLEVSLDEIVEDEEANTGVRLAKT